MDANDVKKAAEEAIRRVNVEEIKAGHLSSELYVIAGTILSTLITSATGVPVPAELLVSLIALAGGYLASRTHLKSKALSRKK
jgi:hypothetical protein